jgi:hypothetical protein
VSAFIRLAHIRKLRGINHFQAAVLRQLFNRFFGCVGGLLPLFGFAP